MPSKTYGRLRGRGQDVTRQGTDIIRSELNTVDVMVRTFLSEDNSGFIELWSVDDSYEKVKILDLIPFDKKGKFIR
jgi:hypothetical protein